MKRFFLYSSIFVLFFIASVVVSLPVSVALKYMPPVRGLNIQGAQGTIWQGQASQVNWQRYHLGDLHWDFQWHKIWQGNVEFAVRFGRGGDLGMRGRGFVGYNYSTGPYANNLLVSAPAQTLLTQAKPMMPFPIPVTVDGQVELDIQHLVYAAPWCKDAKGTLVWNGAQAQTPFGELKLGPVISNVNCADQVVKLSGKQQSLQVSAKFSTTLKPNQSYQSQGSFKPGAEFPQNMSAQLKWLGEPNNQGEYSFSDSGYF